LCERDRFMIDATGDSDSDSHPTRWSLLSRLKKGDDPEGWKVFFDTYSGLIYNVAIKSGLTAVEAEDVVQETLAAVAKNLKGFEADPKRGSFKAWLLKTTRWRILNQFNKRRPDQKARVHRPVEDTRQTATVDRLPGSGAADFDSIWDAEWREHLIAAALERLKQTVQLKHFQIFLLHAIKGRSIRDVCESLGVNAAQVYIVKHRLGRQFKVELERLKREMT
jgi:RNA polymerase sigma factor (sigma-70 family)